MHENPISVEHPKQSLRRQIWHCIPCRLFLIFAAIIIGFILAAVLLVNPVLNHLIKPELVSRINNERGHHIQLGSLSYTFFGNTITALDINYNYNDEDIRIHASAPLIDIRGIPWLRLITGGSLSLRYLSVNNPEVRIESLTKKKEEPKKNIIDQLRDIIPRDKAPLRIGGLDIINGTFRNRKFGASKDDYVNNLSVYISEVYIHNSRVQEDVPLKLANSITMQSGKLIWGLPDSKYILKCDSIDLSSSDSLLTIRGMSFKSFLSPLDFFDGEKFRSSRMAAYASSISVKGLDLPSLIKRNEYNANIIALSGLNLEMITDKRVPPDPAIVPLMPNELISGKGIKLNIRALKLSGSEIHVKELWSDKLISHLPFTGIKGVISNLRSSAGMKHPVRFDVSAKLADAGELNVNMNLPLNTKECTFNYEGSLGKMSVLHLNDHLKVADKTELTSGTISNVTFKVGFSRGTASAGVVPIYNNLKIKTLTKESKEGGVFKDIETFLANSLKIRESNPDKEGKIKSGNTIYTRQKGDFFLDIVWKSLKKSLGEVVGF